MDNEMFEKFQKEKRDERKTSGMIWAYGLGNIIGAGLMALLVVALPGSAKYVDKMMGNRNDKTTMDNDTTNNDTI